MVSIKKISVIFIILLLILCGCESGEKVTINGNILINNELTDESFQIVLYEKDGNDILQTVSVDEDNSFNMVISNDGDYSLKVQCLSGNTYKSNILDFSIKDGKSNRESFNFIVVDELVEQTSSIAANKPSIKGKVKFPQDIDYLDIKIKLSKEVDGTGLKFYMINENGEFQINDLDDGIYYLNALNANNENSDWLKIEIQGGELLNKDDIILELKINKKGES